MDVQEVKISTLKEKTSHALLSTAQLDAITGNVKLSREKEEIICDSCSLNWHCTGRIRPKCEASAVKLRECLHTSKRLIQDASGNDSWLECDDCGKEFNLFQA